MGTNVISVTRQFGSLGRPIAKMVAERMGYEYLDRDIIETAAAQLGEPVYKLSEYEDRVLTPYEKMAFPLGFGTSEKQNRLFEIEKKIILDFTAERNCVIVGRCSDYILRMAGIPNLLNVFIYAPYEVRYNYCLTYLGFSEDAVEKYIDKIDSGRSGYYKKYTGENFDSTKYRDLMISSAYLPLEKLVALICAAAKLKFGEKGQESEETCSE
ncbi:MAG: cytidylate kinase-like family protein [Ethanoligenens sp.]|uniref:cytidylate kinase-like family protein n=1 Tax=Ethanoligenens sp. TaxID=2099655 RepID=UPI0039EB1FE1